LPAACVLCWVVFAGCGSRTGFLDGDGVGGALQPDDDPTGNAGSGGSAGAGGLGLGGGSMVGAAGSSVQPPDIAEPTPPEVERACAQNGAFEGNVVVFDDDALALLEGCRELRGDLEILGRVTALSALRSLEQVNGTVTIGRGTRSLEGLENLREVRVLVLDSIVAPSLEPLAGLQRLRTLSISGDVPQGNLSGLGGILNLRELEISGSALPSVAGLAVPARMSAIRIVDSATSELSALAGVTNIDDDLALMSVQGLTTLDSFAGLISVENLALANNPDLVHVDGVGQVSGLEYLFVSGNPKLEHLPDFESARRLQILQIDGNPLLRNVPRFGPLTRFTQLTIQGNPVLERVEFPALDAELPSLERGVFFSIIENAALTQISAAGLTETGSLTVAANPLLASADFPLLQQVPGRLTVVMNPSLQSGGLGTVLTAATSARKVGGNQGDTPLASCPYTNDDHCDQFSNVCAAGSDLVDCNAGYPSW
jgi:hypothetical protein